MEGSLTWEYNTLINELTQGMEQANQLRFHLCSTSPSEARDLLLPRISSSFEKALLILKWRGSVEQTQVGPRVSVAPESSISVDGSPKSEELSKNFKDNQDYSASKKRKLQPTWMEQVKVNENGLEGPTDDGYSWRKYGQKDILGATYPRSYYRCTYRLVKNCWATKQVQRSDDDPTVFEITYRGTHTCNQCTTPATPEKQEVRHHIHDHQQQSNPTLLNFKTNLRVTTQNLEKNETPNQFSFPSTYAGENHYFPVVVDDNHQLGLYSSIFLSPATSESNYFSHQLKNFGGANNYQHSESDIGEIISGHASTTNSPIGGMELFPIENVELDPNFLFNAPGYF